MTRCRGANHGNRPAPGSRRWTKDIGRVVHSSPLYFSSPCPGDALFPSNARTRLATGSDCGKVPRSLPAFSRLRTPNAPTMSPLGRNPCYRKQLCANCAKPKLGIDGAVEEWSLMACIGGFRNPTSDRTATPRQGRARDISAGIWHE